MEGSVVMIDVSAGVILRGGRLLICQRSRPPKHAGLWEFPGGKREPYETAAQCLHRECQEELGILLSVGDVIAELDWGDSDGAIHFTFLQATVQAGEPESKEHSTTQWIFPEHLRDFAFCPADALALDTIIETLHAKA